MKKKLILLFATSFTAMLSYCQQDSQFTQYMYNTINVNPAYSGSRDVLSVFVMQRMQWVGLDGAPVTNVISINSPLNGTNWGLGVSLVNDKLGPTSENIISTDLSYTIQTSENWKLSFGIKATANVFNLDSSKLNPLTSTANFQSYQTLTPNIGSGLYYYSEKAYIGFSIPNFIETDRYNDNEVAVFKEKINYYLIGGLVFDVADKFKFKPAFLTKIVQGAPLQIDVSGNFLFFDKLTLGASYRWSAAISAMAGFQVSDGFYIGYGYDQETTNLANFNQGSHELFIRYELFKTNSKITSPRFF
jgi:type IX secretion system PorP/SprF family membrane protein